ncbi:MAG TPA: NUDIX hydrolase [Sphingomicrobium sp.]|nr:NUDIX hydrolase [Sphingomicrobium sp.]
MRQAAALPYRNAAGPGGAIEILLVTSSSGRWIIPKGDIDDGMAPHLAAEKEAFEEGGACGRINARPIGEFHARKDLDGDSIQVEVEVFPLHVIEVLDRWPEMDQRDRKWLPRDAAAEAVEEPELRELILGFAAR